ncbi:MAG: Omp28-related outer membrane protein [Bacteroidales bacterium]|nr:Omp28-related outer membrane protein [Bacteroidales bacterium]
MKKWLIILLCLLPVLSCVGQKDDPEDEPIDNPEPKPQPDPESHQDPNEDQGPYFRRSLILDFTGTWCVNCPKMQTAIYDACEQRPGRIVVVSVHCLSVDPMALTSESAALIKEFGVSAYPSAVVDLDPSSLTSTSSTELLLSHCDRLLEARGDACGIKISSTLDGGALKVDVEATPVRDGSYSIHLVLLEDGVVAKQIGASDDYVHNDVLRAWLDAPSAFEGVTGQAFSASFSLDGAAEGMRVAAIVRRDGTADNAASCHVGEQIDYQHEPKI